MIHAGSIAVAAGPGSSRQSPLSRQIKELEEALGSRIESGATRDSAEDRGRVGLIRSTTCLGGRWELDGYWTPRAAAPPLRPPSLYQNRGANLRLPWDVHAGMSVE